VAGCDVLYYDPTHLDRAPAGQPLDSASSSWQPCRAPSHIWMDPELVLRHVCARHRRQLIALHAAGLATQVRWQRPGLAIGPAPSSKEQAR
jgi:hypothetical protein